MRLTALIVACALFMQNLDSTVIATALPTMARAFGADPLHMNVALTAYLLSLAVFIPASGWVADRYGARNVFRAAIGIFTVGSVLCGRADSLWFLVLARIFQGLGGAMMVPVGRLVLLRSVAKSELVAAMAWLTMPALIGPVVGPPLGGLIVTYTSWRWIFDINVPIGIAGMILVSLYIQDVREPRPDRFDGAGLFFSGLCLAALMAALETVGRALVPGWVVVALFAVGLVSGGFYGWHAWRHPHPVLDLALMRLPSFGVSVLGGTLFRIGIGAVPFLLPLMLQLGFGDSPAESGMVTFASSAGAIIMKPATQLALRQLGFRDTLVVNGVLSAVLLGLMAAFRPTWPAAAIYAVLLAGGFFRSLQFTAYNTLAFADIPRDRMSAATSLYSTVQQLSLTLGISAGAGILEVTTALTHHAQPTNSDFSVAFVVIAFVSILAAPASLLMPRDAGEEMSGKHFLPTPPGTRA
jgi:EmrB/QacA subfamily drug resistance transporter